jgi:type IV secretory pathway TrbD component
MAAPDIIASNPVYRVLSKPLTIWGIERRLFFLAMVMGAATFSYFSSLVGALSMFGSLLYVFRLATRIDHQILKIIMNSSRFQPQYDPLKRDHYNIQRIP